MFVQLKKKHFNQEPGARVDVDDAVGNVLITSGIAEPLQNDPLAPLLTRSMETMLSTLTTSLNSQIEATLKGFADAQARSLKNKVPAIFGEGNKGDPDKTFGKFLLAVRRGDAKALEAMGSHFAEWDAVEQKTALTTTSGQAGGYTLPTDFYEELLMASVEGSIARPRSTIIPMTSRSVQVPYLDVTNVPTAGQTAFYGGLVAQWTEEATTLNETEPQFRQIELIAHELSGYTLAANALLADNAVGLEAVLTNLFGGAIGWFEDYAFLRGDGAGKPTGALTGAAAISVSRGTGNTFKIGDAGTMLGSLLPGWNAKSTVWIVHPTVIPQLLQMVSAAAGVGWVDNLRDKLPIQLLGLPVAISEKMSALGTAKDVALIDFRHYLIGDRQQVEIAYSEHFKFTNNQGTWRFVSRCDGQPWLRSAVTLSNATSTVSPYVYLT